MVTQTVASIKPQRLKDSFNLLPRMHSIADVANYGYRLMELNRSGRSSGKTAYSWSMIGTGLY